MIAFQATCFDLLWPRADLICKESIAWEPRYSLFTGEDTHSAVIIHG